MPAAEPVTKTTAATPSSRDPAGSLNIGHWKTSDVQKWLKENKLQHLLVLKWCDTIDSPSSVTVHHDLYHFFSQNVLLRYGIVSLKIVLILVP